MTWKDDLKIEDLKDGDFKLLASLVGMKRAMDIVHSLGGLQLYIPKYETLYMTKKKQYIIDNFNGSNHKELAQATGLSQRAIYDALAQNVDERQIDFLKD